MIIVSNLCYHETRKAEGMTTAIFPGSFDPVTNGHLDILKRGSEIFDKVIIAIAYNSEKHSFLPIEVRKQLLEECVRDLDNVVVESFYGLTVDFARKNGASVILRGLRNSKDFEYEKEIEGVNKSLNSRIHTVYLCANPEFNYISSSAVREILLHKGDISGFVPKNVAEYLIKNIK